MSHTMALCLDSPWQPRGVVLLVLINLSLSSKMLFFSPNPFHDQQAPDQQAFKLHLVEAKHQTASTTTAKMVHRFNHDVGTEEGQTKMEQLPLWKKAKDLEALFSLNYRFLRGELRIHAAHGRPLYDETAGVCQGLIALNEYGMFTFQGQPKVNEKALAPHEQHVLENIQPTETEAWCRCCAYGRCYADCSRWSHKRLLPFLQFCVPVEREGTVSAANALVLAKSLLRDERIHTMVSWPKHLEIHGQDARSYDVPWTNADLKEAKKYIPEADLDEYNHFKSVHHTSSAHEIRSADSEWGLKWKQFEKLEDWPEVNDYHLMSGRVPDWFLGRESRTVIIGVNAVFYTGKKAVENIEALVLEKARMAGFGKVFPDPDNKVAENEADKENRDPSSSPEPVGRRRKRLRKN